MEEHECVDGAEHLSLPSVKQKKEVNLIDKMLIFLSCCVDKPNSK
jgi:hypothetical protein